MIFSNKRFLCALLTANLLIAPIVSPRAKEFLIPVSGNTLIGAVQYTTVARGDTPSSVAQRYDLGLNSIVAANPGSTERSLGPTELKIPTAFILPSLPHEGIIINLPEMRLYYFPEGSDTVMTFPIGIGKIGNTIPIRNTSITRKKINPTWFPGPAVRAYNIEQGIELPAAMGPGPDNPLGPYAIYLNIPSFLIHSTIFPESIGRRASFGCIRMNETDIKEFYPRVLPGTSVAIVNMPFKLGWNGDKLYFEAHRPLAELNAPDDVKVEEAVTAVQKILPANALTLVDWQLVAQLTLGPDGVPHEVGTKIR